MTNKFFYDEVKSANSDAYGFSKTGDSWLFEYQLIFSKMFENDSFTANVSLSPSLRYIDAFYANDFFHEIFDRVDLTVGFNPLVEWVPTYCLDLSSNRGALMIMPKQPKSDLLH